MQMLYNIGEAISFTELTILQPDFLLDDGSYTRCAPHTITAINVEG